LRDEKTLDFLLSKAKIETIDERKKKT
jgi:hypothetical protein